MKRLLLSLIVIPALSFSAFSQANIAEARTYAVGATLTVSGIVTNGSQLGTIRYIQDETAGIGIYDFDVTYFQPGDHVTVTGKMDNYNQLLEVAELTAHAVNSQGNPLPEPQLITVDEMAEEFEGEIVRINQVTFVNAGGNFSGNTNYVITADGENGEVRINTASPLVGQLIPTAEVDLIGILSQFDYNNPNEGYQLLLRTADDIILGESIALTSPVSVAGLTQSGFSLSWETSLPGTTQMRYGYTPSLELGVYNGPAGNSTAHTLSFSGAEPSTLFYIKVFSVKGPDTAYSALRPVITQSASSGDIKVYFTNTVDNSVSAGTDAIYVSDAVDDTLINYIGRAKASIDIAIYNFGAVGVSNIAGALNAAYDRGVQIRLIVNGLTANQGLEGLNPNIRKIASPTAGTDPGIMHNKFVVFDAYSFNADDPLVWTGSTNWTNENVNTDANNVIILQDQSLAIAYTLEFNEMWGSSGPEPNQANSRFGFDKRDDTPHEFIIRGSAVNLYFSPSDGVNQKIIETINTADADIEVNTMLITRSDIGYAIRDKAQTGVNTRVMVNSDGDCTETVVNTLTNALGANFRKYGESGTLHSKAMIVDQSAPNSQPLVLTGSHNWSSSANDKNDENTLIIYDAEIANIFYQEFMARYNAGTPLAIKEINLPEVPLSIYPNPASSDLAIELPAGSQGTAKVSIFNRLGQVVLERNIAIDGNETLKFNLNELPAGFYILNIQGEEFRSSEKLIIVR
jgi:phosphatidylserine/phosphatidylglycerophosphate/cardiolipin synthase-like enzyme